MPVFKVTKFGGVDNIDPRRGMKFSTLENVDITRSGGIRTRAGHRRVSALPAHSLFGHNGAVLFRSGADLVSLADDDSTTVVATGFASQPMSYVGMGSVIIFSDGVDTGVYDIEAGEAGPWGLPVPDAPTVALATNGGLAKGVYGVCLTYLTNDGRESGASQVSTIDCQTGGFNVHGVAQPSDPSIIELAVYVSGVNGGTYNRVLSMPLGAGQRCAVRNNQYDKGVLLTTRYLAAPPAGSILEFYRGHLYVVAGNVVWPTEAMKYDLFDRRKYIGFDGKVVMFKASENGIFVATTSPDEVFFFAGTDPQSGFTVKNRTKISVIPNSAAICEGVQLPNGEPAPGSPVIFATTDGFYVGLNDGTILPLTADSYKVQEALRATATVVPDADSRKVIFSLANNPVRAAGSTRMPGASITAVGRID